MATLENFDDIGFLSLSTLLSVSQGPQEPQGHDEAASDSESLDGEDWDVISEKDSVTPHKLSKLAQKERQFVKFLNHVAETFAREKSIPWSQIKRHERRGGTRSSRGASHVTASGLVTTNGEPTVYIAKNGGVDDKDEELTRYLTIWMRTIAATGKRPTINSDIMWAKLVDYCRQRLDIYATQIGTLSQSELTVAYVEGSDGNALIRELHNLSTTYKTDKSLDLLRHMVSIAYQLRYEPAPDVLSIASGRVRSTICFLGRLRSAYEAFKETAIQFRRSFTKLTVVCLQAPQAQLLAKSPCERRIEELARANGISKPKRERLLKILGKEKSQEIMLAMPPTPFSLPRQKTRKKKASTKREIVTDESIRFGALHCQSTRLPTLTFGSISTTLQDIQNSMFQQLRIASPLQRPALAESSTNVTVHGGPLKRRALAKQRVVESSAKPESAEDRLDILKDFVCSRKCLRIPATSESPHFHNINFYMFPDGYISREPRNFKIPDFGAFWGVYNFEHANRQTTMTDQNPTEVNGDYLLYWCLNDALPPNQNLMSLLGIKSLGIYENFWYGDVFITRFHEDDKSFEFRCEDVPQTILGLKNVITNIFQGLWESNYLEDEITSWQYFEAMEEKSKADKDILLGRMSPTERNMLKKMPGMLEYLAITSCDDGAMIDAALEESEDTLEHVMIKTVYR